MNLLVKIAIVVTAFTCMEGVTCVMHKHVMHGIFWHLHRDHHLKKHLAVIIDAHHHCVSSRGVKDAGSTTLTAEYSGQFLIAEPKSEFFNISDHEF